MLEAHSITGVAKGVLEFAKEAANGHSGLPRIELSILAFDRGQGENYLTKMARYIDTKMDSFGPPQHNDPNAE